MKIGLIKAVKIMLGITPPIDCSTREELREEEKEFLRGFADAFKEDSKC